MNSQQIASLDQVNIHLFDLRTGGADELLMLHGVGRAGRTFSSFATLLPSRYRIRAIDFRGHGGSGRAGHRYRVVNYVLDAIAVIEAIGGPVALYGHSLGSLVATAVASQRPELISAIVLEDPPSAEFWNSLASTYYLPTFRAMQKWAGRRDISVAEIAQGFGSETLRTFSDGRELRIGDVRDSVSTRFTASCLRDLDPAVMAVILEGNWTTGFDMHQIVEGVQCPVLLLRGDVAKGGMLPEPDAETLIKRFRSGVCMNFPAAGHLLHWQVPSEAAVHTGAFLESL